MNFKLQTVLLALIVILLAACGSPPLTAPERAENIAQSEPAVQTEPTATLALVGGSADSPLASPTASVEPTESPTPSPTSPGARPSETPRPTETPGPPTQTPRSTRTPPPLAPTATPAPNETATFTPENPIGNYIFETPEELPGLDDSVIKGWVPGSAEEMIVMGGDFLETVNILTGEKQRLAEWNAETHAVTDNSFWVSSDKEVTLIPFNLQTNQYELWTSASGGKPIRRPSLINVRHSFIPAVGGLGVYDLETQTLAVISNQGKTLQTKLPPQQAALNTPESLPYKVLQWRNRIVYYNRDNFLLINLDTNESKSIDFTNEQGQSLSAWGTQWNSDSSKLALLVSQRNPTLTFMDLYVYDVVTDKLQKIQTPFTHFIDSVAWAPDNRHVVVNAIIGEAEYQTSNGPLVSDANALFLVDTMTTEYSPISIHSPDVASSIGQVLWSLDGKYLVARYRFYEGGIHTYRIEVKSQ